MLTVKYIDALWHWGYCSEAIECLSVTEDGQRGATERIAWLQEHLPYCADCTYANALKEINERVAERLGPEAQKLYLGGDDLRELPGFLEAFKSVVEKFDEEHVANSKVFWDWVRETRKHQDEYPGPARQAAEEAHRGKQS